MNVHWRPHRSSSSRRHRFDAPIGLVLTALALVAALLFGGASRNNALQITVAEVAALPALVWAIWRMTVDQAWGRYRTSVALIGLIVLIPVLQLIPLPPGLWENWPGHAAAAAALKAAEVPIGWRPISLTPGATFGHMLALIPPAAIFLSALTLTVRERGWLAGVIVMTAVFSIMIGVLQIAGGEASPLYFYDPTNYGSAVGLFSNRNHQAALLVISLPFAAFWAARARKDGRYRVLIVAVAVSVLLIAIIGLVIVKSRAGVFLLVPAVVASLLILRRGERSKDTHRATLIGAGVLVVILAVAAFGMGPLMERFGSDAFDGRGVTTATVLGVSSHYLPVGSGIGSFIQVYTSVEPQDIMTRAYWNHAHNDYAEIWLETGLLGLMAILAFVAWWLYATWKVWRTDGMSSMTALARAGSVASAILLIHSTVDYPMRTLTLAAVFAFSWALMAAALAADEPDGES